VHVLIYLPLAARSWLRRPRGRWPGGCPPQSRPGLLTAAAGRLAGLSTAVLGLLALTAILRIPLDRRSR